MLKKQNNHIRCTRFLWVEPLWSKSLPWEALAHRTYTVLWILCTERTWPERSAKNSAKSVFLMQWLVTVHLVCMATCNLFINYLFIHLFLHFWTTDHVIILYKYLNNWIPIMLNCMNMICFQQFLHACNCKCNGNCLSSVCACVCRGCHSTGDHWQGWCGERSHSW